MQRSWIISILTPLHEREGHTQKARENPQNTLQLLFARETKLVTSISRFNRIQSMSVLLLPKIEMASRLWCAKKSSNSGPVNFQEWWNTGSTLITRVVLLFTRPDLWNLVVGFFWTGLLPRSWNRKQACLGCPDLPRGCMSFFGPSAEVHLHACIGSVFCSWFVLTGISPCPSVLWSSMEPLYHVCSSLQSLGRVALSRVLGRMSTLFLHLILVCRDSLWKSCQTCDISWSFEPSPERKHRPMFKTLS